jgi:hypothetical protein
MMFNGTRVPSFEIAKSFTTSASSNRTGEVSTSAVRVECAVAASKRYQADGSK